MASSVIIYALIDPRSMLPRYIGRTKNPIQLRLEQHLNNATKRNAKSNKVIWIRELSSLGLRPLIRQIEICDYGNGEDRETFWISKYNDLTNERDGRSAGENKFKAAWTPDEILMLGMEADSKIAERLGVDRKTVTYKRRTMGIPASHNRERNKKPPNMGGWNKAQLSENIIEKLGLMPDYKLAALAGVSKEVIARARKKNGIISFAETTGNNGRYQNGNYPQRWINRG